MVTPTTDPGANYDLASRYPEKHDAMEKIMRGWNREIEYNTGKMGKDV